MAIDALIAGALGVMVDEAFQSRENPLEKANAEATERVGNYSRGMGLAIPDLDMKDVWFKEMTVEVEECAEALDKLYKAIQYYPTDGEGDWRYFDLDRVEYKPGITQLKIDPTHKRPVMYVIDFIIDRVTVAASYNPQASFNFRYILDKVKPTLKSIQEKFWVPNESNWKQWVRLAMKVQGASDLDIEDELASRKIPLNCPANDIVYRTEAEVKWFKQVAARIYSLSKKMILAAQNWANLLQRGWPSEAFMNKRNYMSWDMYLQLLR